MSEHIYQIGILGGSFDPVHYGHIGLAQETYEKFGLDQILFVPVLQSPHKKHIPMTTSFHRMAMLKLALQNNAHFKISEMEVRRKEISYTIDTLNRFRLIYPSSELFLIIGYDNLLELDAWKDSLIIMKNYNILVASRPGKNLISSEEKVLGMFKGDSPYCSCETQSRNLDFFHQETGTRLIVYDISPKDISSSNVRDRLACGKSLDNLLPPEVETYIIENQIYKI
jgi:nicotinate-nucleotide adenylyltransferase